jgi:hypothetical protein
LGFRPVAAVGRLAQKLEIGSTEGETIYETTQKHKIHKAENQIQNKK